MRRRTIRSLGPLAAAAAMLALALVPGTAAGAEPDTGAALPQPTSAARPEPTGTTRAAAGDYGAATSGVSELTESARVLGGDRESALRAYWTEERRANAIPADTLTIDPDDARRGEVEPVGEVGQVEAARPDIRPAPRDPGPRGGGSGSAADAGSEAQRSAAAFWPYRGDEPATTVGKVFFTDQTNGLTYVCSATVVDSAAKNLVWTAGHCVHHGPGGGWHANWVFYPHYYHGADPTYGAWYPRELWSWTKWINNGQFRYDYGAALMWRDGWGNNIVNRTGAQGFAWNHSKNQYVYDFGYPAVSPFNGATLQYCHGAMFKSGSDVGLMCNMTGGSSGGPWLIGFNGYGGWVNGVNSYKINGVSSKIFSPYFGNAARDLYFTVANRY